MLRTIEFFRVSRAGGGATSWHTRAARSGSRGAGWAVVFASSWVALAAGCGGSVRDETVGCVYGGHEYALGASFSATDGCNSCVCTRQGAECSTKACACTDSLGNPQPYGASFPAGDNCNTCSCSPQGLICTHRTCIAPPQCSYGGQLYNVGDRFPSVDGCNTCECEGDAIACTAAACGVVEAGPPPIACTYAGQSYALGDLFPSVDGCNSCKCSTSGVACTEAACPACSYNGYYYGIGDRFPPIDDCPGYCSCTDAGVSCPSCDLDAAPDAFPPPPEDAGAGSSDAGDMCDVCSDAGRCSFAPCTP